MSIAVWAFSFRQRWWSSQTRERAAAAHGDSFDYTVKGRSGFLAVIFQLLREHAVQVGDDIAEQVEWKCPKAVMNGMDVNAAGTQPKAKYHRQMEEEIDPVDNQLVRKYLRPPPPIAEKTDRQVDPFAISEMPVNGNDTLHHAVLFTFFVGIIGYKQYHGKYGKPFSLCRESALYRTR